MNLDDIAFVTGDPATRGSVIIRSCEIASRLEMAEFANVHEPSVIPPNYQAFVFVRSEVSEYELSLFHKRGMVIWDVIDDLPPKKNVDVYLFSTEHARNFAKVDGRTEVIPHPHCNVSRAMNPDRTNPVQWIGNRDWIVRMPGVEVVTGWPNNFRVAENYRRAGILANYRKHTLVSETHVPLNSGIKLINCIGFGIPSVSDAEPAYMEYGEGCAVFCKIEEAPEQIERLKKDAGLRKQLRDNCAKKAEGFHIHAICARYKRFLENLDK